jgi:hypothetical protein
MGAVTRIALAGIALIAACTPAFSQSRYVTLEWDPNTEPTVATYRIYAGIVPGTYTLPVQSVPASQTKFVYTVPAGVAYYFAITAVDGFGNESSRSAEVSASVPALFSDTPLIAGVTTMKAAHINELRMRINSLRAASGLAAVYWTNSMPGTTVAVRAVHLTEMRTALNAVYTARSLPPPNYTDPTITAGSTVIKAAHINQLRSAITALE